MKKWYAATALMCLAASGFAWSTGESDVPPAVNSQTSSRPDPYSSGEAQCHFTGQPAQRVSMVLIVQ